ncbi:competence protein ComGB [Weissella uvarum]|uniref:type II secretion system F family protein n=1 Tax=Weissella uvarum TaxID=1479233 RepID=UPI00195F9F9D|nr:type II secretion system F family protein [Weissella uvarum]MBM7617776.1 competence protein ComGB [Weissella uvarum]MCM0595845.1 type II secretion system F family protein [Weissella uvarum]
MRTKRWRRKQQAEFFIRLGRLLDNGFDLMTALQLMMQQKRLWGADFQYIMSELQAGKALKDALKPFVDQKLVAELYFVELHGELIAYLNQLGQRERHHHQYVRKFWQLASYPLFLLGLILVLTFYFVHQFSKQTLDLSNGWIWGWMGAGLGIMIAGWKWHPQLSWWVQYVPGLSDLWRTNLQVQLCFQMGCLIKAGVNLADILLIFEQQPVLRTLRSYATLENAVKQALDQGRPLSEVLQFLHCLPKGIQSLFDVGQTSEKVGLSLLHFAKELQRELEQNILLYLQLSQPLLFMLIGICIIGLYGEFLLPNYQTIEGLPGK